MRYPIMLGTILLVMFLGTGKSSAAAWDDPPGGSYRASCKNIKVRGDVLFARCKDYNNHWVDTQLNDYNRCGGDISNTGGQLRCNDNGNANGDGDRDRDRGRAPRGSYSQTCRNIDVRGDTLSAECDTGNGDWRRTSLDHYDDCSGEIVNDNGELECTRRGGRQVPRGTYVQTCRNIYVRGDKLRANCQTGDGGWNWSQLDDWDDCRGGIVNDRGHLVCRKDRDRD